MPASSKKKVLVNEIAAQKLISLIKEENLQPGDKLPSERTLSQQLGISRTSLREALINLKASGVVRIRQGSGIYVDVIDGFTHNNDLDNHNVPANINHMLDVRFMIEPYCIRQVAKNITPEQIEQLRELEMQRYRGSFYNTGQSDTAIFPRIDFEGLIISFLGNPFISDIYNQLSLSWKNTLDQIDAIVLEADIRHKQHLEIIKALEENNPDKAEKATIHHLNLIKESIFSQTEQHKSIEPEHSGF